MAFYEDEIFSRMACHLGGASTLPWASGSLAQLFEDTTSEQRGSSNHEVNPSQTLKGPGPRTAQSPSSLTQSCPFKRK